MLPNIDDLQKIMHDANHQLILFSSSGVENDEVLTLSGQIGPLLRTGLLMWRRMISITGAGLDSGAAVAQGEMEPADFTVGEVDGPVSCFGVSYGQLL